VVTCIFCLKPKPRDDRSVEHVFPESLGGTITMIEVCRTCNSRIGTQVDRYLTDHWAIQNDRLLKGLRGKDGKLPNPFARGRSEDKYGNPVQVRMEHGKISDIYAVTNIKPVKNEGGVITGYDVTVDGRDEAKLPDIIAGLKKRHAALGQDLNVGDQRVRTDAGSQITQHVPFDTYQYYRAILKVGYELTYLFCGPAYLDDPIGTRIRDLINSPCVTLEDIEAAQIGGGIGPLGGQPSRLLFPPENDHLTASVNRVGDLIGVTVNILNTFEGTMCMSRTAHRYGLPDALEGPLYVVDVAKKTTTRTTTLAQIQGLQVETESGA